jgi:hypothetical protein
MFTLGSGTQSVIAGSQAWGGRNEEKQQAAEDFFHD